MLKIETINKTEELLLSLNEIDKHLAKLIQKEE